MTLPCWKARRDSDCSAIGLLPFPHLPSFVQSLVGNLCFSFFVFLWWGVMFYFVYFSYHFPLTTPTLRTESRDTRTSTSKRNVFIEWRKLPSPQKDVRLSLCSPFSFNCPGLLWNPFWMAFYQNKCAFSLSLFPRACGHWTSLDQSAFLVYKGSLVCDSMW